MKIAYLNLRFSRRHYVVFYNIVIVFIWIVSKLSIAFTEMVPYFIFVEFLIHSHEIKVLCKLGYGTWLLEREISKIVLDMIAGDGKSVRLHSTILKKSASIIIIYNNDLIQAIRCMCS